MVSLALRWGLLSIKGWFSFLCSNYLHIPYQREEKPKKLKKHMYEVLEMDGRGEKLGEPKSKYRKRILPLLRMTIFRLYNHQRP